MSAGEANEQNNGTRRGLEQTAQRIEGRDLDSVDRRILALLRRDPRLSARAIARQVQMSPGAITERLNRLQHSGVIAGYQLAINPASFGYDFHAFIGLQTAQGITFEQAIENLRHVPEVVTLHVVTGPWDILAEVLVRDHDHFLEVLTDRIMHIPGFRHSETMISLRSYSHPQGWHPPQPDEDDPLVPGPRERPDEN